MNILYLYYIIYFYISPEKGFIILSKKKINSFLSDFKTQCFYTKIQSELLFKSWMSNIMNQIYVYRGVEIVEINKNMFTYHITAMYTIMFELDIFYNDINCLIVRNYIK